MKTLMTLSFPLGSELMTTVRLATGGVCSLAGLSLDDSEDCKVCVTESLLLLTHAGFSEARVAFAQEEGRLCVRIDGAGEGRDEQPAPEDEISAVLLGALAEDTAIEKENGRVNAVSFGFSV